MAQKRVANEQSEPAAFAGMLVGAIVTFLLAYLRTVFVGFPLSPSAYKRNVSWA